MLYGFRQERFCPFHVESDITLKRFETCRVSWYNCSRRRHVSSLYVTILLHCWWTTDVIVLICSGSYPTWFRNEAKFCINSSIEMFKGWLDRCLCGMSFRLPCFVWCDRLLFAVDFFLPFLLERIYLVESERGYLRGLPNRPVLCAFCNFVAVVIIFHLLPRFVNVLKVLQSKTRKDLMASHTFFSKMAGVWHGIIPVQTPWLTVTSKNSHQHKPAKQLPGLKMEN